MLMNYVGSDDEDCSRRVALAEARNRLFQSYTEPAEPLKCYLSGMPSSVRKREIIVYIAISADALGKR